MIIYTVGKMSQTNGKKKKHYKYILNSNLNLRNLMALLKALNFSWDTGMQSLIVEGDSPRLMNVLP
jgi:ribonuclease HI